LEIKEVEAFLLGNPGELGALVWLVDKPDFLSSEYLFYSDFHSSSGYSGERARLFSQLEKYINMMRSLHSIDRTIASSLDLKTVLDFTLQEALRHLKIDAMCLFN